jgi:hypothetical protein
MLGLRVGSGVGLFASILILSNFYILIDFALVLNLSILIVPVVLLFKRRRVMRLGVRNLSETVIGFFAGAGVTFIATLYYFWISLLAIMILAAAKAAYDVIEVWGTRSQLRVEVRRLFRNLVVMFAVMAPLLVFVVLVVGSILSIMGWAIGYAAFSSLVITKYIKDRRQSRATL